MKVFPVLMTTLFFLGGCAHQQALQSADGLSDRYPLQASHLAEEAAEKLAERYPAGSTILYVTPDQENRHFASSLEQTLRLRGFAVSSDSEVADIQISYQTDALAGKKSLGYWRIKSSDGEMFSLVKPLVTP